MSLHYSLSPKTKNVRPNPKNIVQIKPIQKGPSDSLFTLKDISKWFSISLSTILEGINELALNDIEEIRLRVNQPLLLHSVYGDLFINFQGQRVKEEDAYLVKREDLMESLERMTQSSIYAAQNEIKEGFITLPGGHRVGLTGKAVMENGEVQIIKHISGLNMRIARNINSSMGILPLLFKKEPYHESSEFCHTLIISSPRAGKTTLLRSLIQNISNGISQLGIHGQTVGVIDERGEIAGMWQGVPTYDLGVRTDVLEGCSKAKGMMMLIRSMAPQVIATDELGHQDDFEAISEALRSGVHILSTAHAGSLEEALGRPSLGRLLKEDIFERLVVLSRSKGPGTIEGVFDLRKGKVLGYNDREVIT